MAVQHDTNIIANEWRRVCGNSLSKELRKTDEPFCEVTASYFLDYRDEERGEENAR